MEKRKRAGGVPSGPGNVQPDCASSPAQVTAQGGAVSRGLLATEPGRGGGGSGDREDGGDGGLGAQTGGGPLRKQSPQIQEHVQAIDDDDSDEDRLPGKDMIDRANSGKAVISGPEDLGMKTSVVQRHSPEPQVSRQLQKAEQDKQSLPTPDSQVL